MLQPGTQNRSAKHGALPGSVAGSKCTGKNYTGRVRRCFCPSFCPSFYGHPRVTSFESLLSKAVKILATLQSLWSKTVKIWPPSRPPFELTCINSSHACTIVLARGTSRCILCRSNLVSCRNVTYVVLNYQVLLVNTIVPTIINASAHNPSVAIRKQVECDFPDGIHLHCYH